MGRKGDLVFSMEMPILQVGYRLLAGASNVPLGTLTDHTLSDEQWVCTEHGLQQLAALPILLDDSPTLTATDVRNRARILHHDAPLALIVVDYLQLLTGTDSRANRVQQVGEMSRSLKALAMELGVPVVALAQLNREAEKSGTPLLSQLRESGSIEQDADSVTFLSRADDGLTEQQWERLHPTRTYPRNLIDVTVAKNRGGETGREQLYFDATRTAFHNLTHRVTE